jgi:hypothetical protein
MGTGLSHPAQVHRAHVTTWQGFRGADLDTLCIGVLIRDIILSRGPREGLSRHTGSIVCGPEVILTVCIRHQTFITFSAIHMCLMACKKQILVVQPHTRCCFARHDVSEVLLTRSPHNFQEASGGRRRRKAAESRHIVT